MSANGGVIRYFAGIRCAWFKLVRQDVAFFHRAAFPTLFPQRGEAGSTQSRAGSSEKQHVRIAILGFLAGIFWLQQQGNLPATWWWPLPLMVLALVWLFRHVQADLVRAMRRIFAIAACVALGVAWATLRAEARLAEELPHEWEARDVEMIGAVASLPQANDRGTRFEVDVEKILTPGAVVPAHISLSWYAETHRKTGEVTPPPLLMPGER